MTSVATFAGHEIARSDGTIVVEGNRYFPLADVEEGVLEPTRKHTVCPWKGVASYADVVAGESRAQNAAWTYKHPFPTGRKVKDRVAFTDAVDVREI